MGSWPLSARKTGFILAVALATIYVANQTGLRQRVVG